MYAKCWFEPEVILKKVKAQSRDTTPSKFPAIGIVEQRVKPPVVVLGCLIKAPVGVLAAWLLIQFPASALGKAAGDALDTRTLLLCRRLDWLS